jgi:deoxycytidine triphosphate deaminase
MILSSNEIELRGLVQNRSSKGIRNTTYDATVGEIIYEGKTHEGPSYVLPARGMVWVVSNEKFVLPADITGLATLRTTWTHNGILALNVGIVDPGWNGNLATALVNFSNTNFQIDRGEAFLRVLFISHTNTNAKDILNDRKTYLGQIRDKSSKIPSTFLDLKSLADEVLNRLYGFSVFASWLTRFGLIIALVAIIATFVPIAYGVSSEFMSRKADIQKMQDDMAKIMNRQNEMQIQQRNLELKIDKGTH